MSYLANFFKGFVAGFKHFGQGITNIVNFILTLVIYIIGVGLTSIVAKAFGKHFLSLRKTNKKSAWSAKNSHPKPDDFYRQF